MTRSIISVGTSANDGTGDTLRDAMIKINNNFNTLWKDDSNLNIQFGSGDTILSPVADTLLSISSNDASVDIAYSGNVMQIEFTIGQSNIGTGSGYLAICRYHSNNVGTLQEIGGFRINSTDQNGYTYICYDTSLGDIDLQEGDILTYCLLNKSDGSIEMPLNLGMRFSVREYMTL